MELVKHETCQQYVARRLSEGWGIVWQSGHHLILSSPDGNILRPVDLRNDIETLRPNAPGDETNFSWQTPSEDSWTALTGYNVGDLVIPITFPTGRFTYECTTAGTSGAGEPAWNRTLGGTTNDGTVVWTARSYHWNKVDEVVADDDTTYVYSPGAYERDLYSLPASSGSGTINSIKIYFRVGGGIGFAKPCLKSDGVVTDGTEVGITFPDWATHSQQWNTNPAPPGTDAWRWADIDALQIGASAQKSTGVAGLTQVYVEVDYSPPAGGSRGFIIG